MQALRSNRLSRGSWCHTTWSRSSTQMENTLAVLWVECLPRANLWNIWSLAGATLGGFMWKLHGMGPSYGIQTTRNIIFKIGLGTQFPSLFAVLPVCSDPPFSVLPWAWNQRTQNQNQKLKSTFPPTIVSARCAGHSNTKTNPLIN